LLDIVNENNAANLKDQAKKLCLKIRQCGIQGYRTTIDLEGKFDKYFPELVTELETEFNLSESPKTHTPPSKPTNDFEALLDAMKKLDPSSNSDHLRTAGVQIFIKPETVGMWYKETGKETRYAEQDIHSSSSAWNQNILGYNDVREVLDSGKTEINAGRYGILKCKLAEDRREIGCASPTITEFTGTRARYNSLERKERERAKAWEQQCKAAEDFMRSLPREE
jgi:hypothetical protein